VYDYAAGEIDWLAHGLETEGETAGALTAGRLARDDVVTCRLDERVGDVRGRIDASPYGFGLVTSAGGVLLGRLRRSALDGDPAARAADMMEAGPSTVRPNMAADKLARRLDARHLKSAIVSTPGGVLVGVILHRELEAALTQGPERPITA
jgi:CBS domain-containing protein